MAFVLNPITIHQLPSVKNWALVKDAISALEWDWLIATLASNQDFLYRHGKGDLLPDFADGWRWHRIRSTLGSDVAESVDSVVAVLQDALREEYDEDEYEWPHQTLGD